MQHTCNKHWVTVDTDINRGLECVFQACIREMVVPASDPDFQPKMILKEKYREFLGLPIVMEIANRHPCKISIAHQIRKQQMRTGWPADRLPLSFRDRNDNDNNILIETWASNLLKSGFPDRYYPCLRQMVLEINMPFSMVDSSLTLSPVNPAYETLFSLGHQRAEAVLLVASQGQIQQTATIVARAQNIGVEEHHVEQQSVTGTSSSQRENQPWSPAAPP